jgi:hypothetical protein
MAKAPIPATSRLAAPVQTGTMAEVVLCAPVPVALAAPVPVPVADVDQTFQSSVEVGYGATEEDLAVTGVELVLEGENG